MGQADTHSSLGFSKGTNKRTSSWRWVSQANSVRLGGERCLACDHSMLLVEFYSIYFLLENDFLDRLHKRQLRPKTPEAFSCSSTCFMPYQELSCSCLPQLHFIEVNMEVWELADQSEFLIAFWWMAETRFLNKQNHGTKPSSCLFWRALFLNSKGGDPRPTPD